MNHELFRYLWSGVSKGGLIVKSRLLQQILYYNFMLRTAKKLIWPPSVGDITRISMIGRSIYKDTKS